ncbi:hypothetical protein OIU84_018754 [Salix udensis]|uniref:Uncharacterized protein n=1 Tax=Salix udensis TaxID=889485 RepID=A0AAD6KX83_9ROSI|nr:hypothetical protein OIU84_018754 [Salix udensis]
MSARRRPLHTCGVSFMEIARKAYTETQEFNGPLGLLTKKMIRLAPFVSLLVYVLQYESIFLAILSFVDDHIILALERKVEAIFPPSKYAFNEVDKLVQIVETLPAKIDFAVGKLPVIFHQIPFLDWAHSCAISWLNFWLSILTHWGSRTTHEKEIVVDINCNDSSDVQTNVQEADKNIVEFQDETKGMFQSLCLQHQPRKPRQVVRTVRDAPVKQPVLKGEKNESMKAKECIADEETEEASASKEETGEGGDHTAAMEDDPVDLPEDKTPESIGKEDPILALFESAWHI